MGKISQNNDNFNDDNENISIVVNIGSKKNALENNETEEI